MAQGIFIFFGVCSLVGSGLVFAGAMGAVHEIEAMLFALVGWLLIIAGVMNQRLSEIRDRLPSPRKTRAAPEVAIVSQQPAKPASEMTLKELFEAEKGANL